MARNGTGFPFRTSIVKVGATAISDVLRLYFISSGAENAIDDVVPAAGSVLW